MKLKLHAAALAAATALADQFGLHGLAARHRAWRAALRLPQVAGPGR